jgi:hypothetical protein
MVKASATIDELIFQQQKIGNERAAANEKLKNQQLEIQSQIDTLTLHERGKSFSDHEIAQLAALREVSPQAVAEEPVNG